MMSSILIVPSGSKSSEVIQTSRVLSTWLEGGIHDLSNQVLIVIIWRIQTKLMSVLYVNYFADHFQIKGL